MITQALIPEKLKSFKYYLDKLPLYLRQSESFKEHFRLWHALLGHEGVVSVETYVVNADIKELETKLKNNTVNSQYIKANNNVVGNLFADPQVVDALKVYNETYNTVYDSIAINLNGLSSSSVFTQSFLYNSSKPLAPYHFNIRLSLTLQNVTSLTKEQKYILCAAGIVNDILNKVNGATGSAEKPYQNYYNTSEYTIVIGTPIRVVVGSDFTGTEKDLQAISNTVNTFDVDRYSFATLQSKDNNIIVWCNNYSQYLYSYEISTTPTQVEETVNTATGLIGNGQILINMLNIFADDYWDFLASIEGSSKDSTVSDVLDKLGNLYGVSRYTTVTYSYKNVTKNEDLVLTNEQFLLLIKAKIIQNYSDGTLQQMNDFYKSAGLNICVNTSDDSATANVYLVYYTEQELTNFDKMFLAGLLNIKSMGINYKQQLLIANKVLIWDQIADDNSNGWGDNTYEGGMWVI